MGGDRDALSQAQGTAKGRTTTGGDGTMRQPSVRELRTGLAADEKQSARGAETSTTQHMHDTTAMRTHTRTTWNTTNDLTNQSTRARVPCNSLQWINAAASQASNIRATACSRGAGPPNQST